MQQPERHGHRIIALISAKSRYHTISQVQRIYWTDLDQSGYVSVVRLGMPHRLDFMMQLLISVQQGLENGFLGYDISSRTATIWDDGNKKFTLTNEGHLSKAVVSVLQRPNETKNQILYIASVETSQNEILNAFETVTGFKWSIIRTTTEEQVTEARMKLSKGDFDGALTLVRATSYSNLPGLKSNYAKGFKVANDILGLEWANVEDTVRTVVSK